MATQPAPTPAAKHAAARARAAPAPAPAVDPEGEDVEANATAIPARFRGAWTAGSHDCDSGRMNQDMVLEADHALFIGERTAVTAIREEGPLLVLRYASEDEDGPYTDVVSYRLSPDGQTLMQQGEPEAEPFPYRRCP